MKRMMTHILLYATLTLFMVMAHGGLTARANEVPTPSMFEVDPDPAPQDATAVFNVGDGIKAYFYEDEELLYFRGTGVTDLKGVTTITTHPLLPVRDKVTRAYFRDGITGIGDHTLCNSTIRNYFDTITELRLPETLEWIGPAAFAQLKNLTAINLPETLTRVGDRAFYGNEKMPVGKLPGGIVSLGDRAFQNCMELTVTELPETLAHMDRYAFWHTGIAIAGLPDLITELHEGTFGLCLGLTSLDLNNVTTLHDGTNNIDGVFQGNYYLTSVKGSNLEYIGDYAFDSCSRLRNVETPNVTRLGTMAFGSGLALQYVQDHVTSATAYERYFNTDNFKNVFPKLEAENIGPYALTVRLTVEDRLGSSGGKLLGTSYYYAFPGVDVPRSGGYWSTPGYMGYTYTGNHTAGIAAFMEDGGASPVIQRYYELVDIPVTYHANGADSGAVPMGGATYHIGETVTVMGNTGDLRRGGQTFMGWGTNTYGSGAYYDEGDEITISNTNPINLYARWRPRSETHRTLTGITATYGQAKLRPGAEINGASLMVRGMYTVTYDNGEQDENVPGNIMPQTDYHLENTVMGDDETSTFTVIHTETGMTATFSLNRAGTVATDMIHVTATYNGGDIPVNMPIDKEYVRVVPTFQVTWEDASVTYEIGEAICPDDFHIYPTTVGSVGDNQVLVWFQNGGIEHQAMFTVHGIPRAEAGRVQTGIVLSLAPRSLPCGTVIDGEDVTAWPLYDIEYNDGSTERGIWGETRIEAADLTISGASVGKGPNTVTVTQTSTGLAAYFTVFGNHADGIRAEAPDGDMEEGTELSTDDFAVFFTYTLMDENGLVSSNVPSNTATLNFTINGGDSCILLAGENEVVIVEQETGEGLATTLYIRAHEKPEPPEEPDEPDEPDDPDDPDEPDNPDEPDEPDNPDEPDDPDDPDDLDEPDNPDEPNGPDEPGEPDNPDEPDDPDESDEPDDSNEPDNPDEPDDPDGPYDPDDPGEPEDPELEGNDGEEDTPPPTEPVDEPDGPDDNDGAEPGEEYPGDLNPGGDEDGSGPGEPADEPGQDGHGPADPGEEEGGGSIPKTPGKTGETGKQQKPGGNDEGSAQAPSVTNIHVTNIMPEVINDGQQHPAPGKTGSGIWLLVETYPGSEAAKANGQETCQKCLERDRMDTAPDIGYTEILVVEAEPPENMAADTGTGGGGHEETNAMTEDENMGGTDDGEEAQNAPDDMPGAELEEINGSLLVSIGNRLKSLSINQLIILTVAAAFGLFIILQLPIPRKKDENG